MRPRIVFGALLAVSAAFAVAQTAAGIHLADVRFDGDTQLKDVDLRRCAADLRSREYEGTDWLARLAERVHDFVQENGYFRALVTPSAEQLPDKDGTHQFIAMFHIEAGRQYRTGDITFRDNHIFSDGELRSMFKLKSGEVFRPVKLRDGIKRMRDAYVARGYNNFSAVPDTNINDSNAVISLVIHCDEAH